MDHLSLYSPQDVQLELAKFVRARRKAQKWSRDALAERSTVPAPTIKRFELTGEISLRQLLLLWQCVDDVERLVALCKPATTKKPTSIEEVLNS
jgi:hypothetical protein